MNRPEQNESREGMSRRGFLTAAATTAGVAALAACSPAPYVQSGASSAAAASTTGALDVRRITPPKLDNARLR